jgi:hypothetical protein
MLITAFASLGAAVVVGTVLATYYLRQTHIGPAPWPFAVAHGFLGLGGLGCLLLSLGGPPRGVDQGTASFGAISAVLIAMAAAAGAALLARRFIKRWRGGTLIGLHATLAVSGFVILAAYLLV